MQGFTKNNRSEYIKRMVEAEIDRKTGDRVIAVDSVKYVSDTCPYAYTKKRHIKETIRTTTVVKIELDPASQDSYIRLEGTLPDKLRRSKSIRINVTVQSDYGYAWVFVDEQHFGL